MAFGVTCGVDCRRHAPPPAVNGRCPLSFCKWAAPAWPSVARPRSPCQHLQWKAADGSTTACGRRDTAPDAQGNGEVFRRVKPRKGLKALQADWEHKRALGCS
ncbi:hypothetical protein R5R35_012321 [Gryllus longicercus]|uniref:Uncharacterized protein n=1 Tax=Gryllus longicercus TaxID=2509291 RepID=A0AAN9V6U3_9ORTH